jgi:signal transduction histidine kinase
MPASNHRSLRARLIQLVLLAVLPALGLILYSAAEQRQLARSSAESEALRAVRVLVASHERLIESTRHLLIALSRLATMRKDDRQACNSQLSGLIKEYPLYTNLGVVNLNGDLICSARPILNPINVADRAYFKNAVQSSAFALGEYQIGRVSGKASLNMAYPTFDAGGELDGIVFAGLDLASLSAIIAAAQVPESYTFTVVDRKGTILARHPNPEQWLGKPAVESGLSQNSSGRGEGIAQRIGPDGKEHLYAYKSFGDLTGKSDLQISMSIPSEIALSEASWVLKRNLAALMIVGLLALLAAWVGSEMFVLRQLNALVATTEKIGKGELSARTGLFHADHEIGRLAAALDEMAEILEMRRVEAAKAREQIQRSLERTRAFHQMDLVIASTLDLTAMLNQLLEKIDMAFPGVVATVRLLNNRTGELEPTACRNIDETAWREGYSKSLRGFAKLVLDSKEPLTVADTQTDPRHTSRFARRFGLASYHGVPLIAKDEILGLIGFYTKEGQSFSGEEIEFLNTLAGQLSLAIHNAKLYEAAKRSGGEIAALHSLTIAATQSLDLDVVLKEAIHKVTEIFSFEATRIFLFNGDMTELHVKAGFESKSEFWNQTVRFRRGESIIGRVTETGEPFICEDIAHDPNYLALTDSRNALRAQARFFGMFPIKTKLKIWGAMVCAGKIPRKLDAAEVNLLQSMNNQIGIAVENATLYQQTATKAKELSALYSIAAIGSESLDINTALDKSMHEVLRIFGFDAARIYLREGDAEELCLAAHAGFPENIRLVKTYRIGEGRVGKAFETGEPMIAEDMQSDSMYTQMAHNKVMLRAGFRSSFLIPIKVRNEGLGVMNFLGKQPHKFSEADQQLVKSIAYNLGITLGNANLFSQIKQKSVELETANKGKDEFLGIISHELRTPLNVIKGYTELIQSQVFGDINPEQDKALAKIVSQTKDLLSMINQVLQVTTIQAGAAKVNCRHVNLCALLDELKSSYAIAKKEVVINWHYPRTLPFLNSDDEKLKAVIQNLINNALKFTEEGSISISAREILEERAIEILVSDTGMGIPREQMETIFGMFQQVDSSTTRKHGGIGLGLYIVKTFTELLGGRVSMQSEIGKGSVFSVTLPTGGAAGQIKELPSSAEA